jgi:hypothetical protein
MRAAHADDDVAPEAFLAKWSTQKGGEQAVDIQKLLEEVIEGRDQGCQIFLGTIYQNGEKYTQ